MDFRLVETGWRNELTTACRLDNSGLRIICPFIKRGVVEDLLAIAQPQTIDVITRFDCRAFVQGVSDLSALDLLLQHGARIRGVRNVHSKIYLVGDQTAIVTSANLTAAALDRNAEFGFVATGQTIKQECRHYFENMWTRAGNDLSEARLREFIATVDRYQHHPGRTQLGVGLPDYGVDLGMLPNEVPIEISACVLMPRQAFVKFWGSSKRQRRLDRATPIVDDVGHAGSHLACTYPRRPIAVQDGAVMFMGRLVRDENDILIHGRAVARKHDPHLDVATPAEVVRRPFKNRYKYLIRVENPEFIDGTLEDAISLKELMSDLGALSFRTTKQRAEAGERDINPAKAYSQQPHVELSEEGFHWLHVRLDQAFAERGKIQKRHLDELENRPLPDLFEDD